MNGDWTPSRVLGYIRVSTDKQTVENQRFEILAFAKRNGFNISGWVEETISGTKDPSKRKLGALLSGLGDGDLLICTEISRLGRSLFMIMDILNALMKRNARVWTIKDNYRLGDDLTAKVLAFAFGLAAEIERNLISQRTKQALARLKLEGRILGRPRGRLGKTKLTPHAEEIKKMLAIGMSQRQIARALHVDRNTLVAYFASGRYEADIAGRQVKYGTSIWSVPRREWKNMGVAQ